MPDSHREPQLPDDPGRSLDPQSSFAELGRIILGSQPLQAVLERVVGLAQQTLPGAAHVSITLVERERAWTAAFSGAPAARLDERQYDAGYGPCMDAAITGETVVIKDTASDDVYADFSATCREHGVTHTLSVGLPIPQRVIGALNIYGAGRPPFDPEAVRLAETFAGYAAVALANAALYQSTVDLAENLQQAMQSRAVIEQAKGILMGQNRCSADEAFAMLSHASQRSNRKLRDVAADIVGRVGG